MSEENPNLLQALFAALEEEKLAREKVDKLVEEIKSSSASVEVLERLTTALGLQGSRMPQALTRQAARGVTSSGPVAPPEPVGEDDSGNPLANFEEVANTMANLAEENGAPDLSVAIEQLLVDHGGTPYLSWKTGGWEKLSNILEGAMPPPLNLSGWQKEFVGVFFANRPKVAPV